MLAWAIGGIEAKCNGSRRQRHFWEDHVEWPVWEQLWGKLNFASCSGKWSYETIWTSISLKNFLSFFPRISMWIHIQKSQKKIVFSCSSNVNVNLATKKPILSNKHHKNNILLSERNRKGLSKFSKTIFFQDFCVWKDDLWTLIISWQDSSTPS